MQRLRLGVASARPAARSGDSTWRARGAGGLPLGRGPVPPPGGHPTRGRGGHLLAGRPSPPPVAEVSRGGSPMGGACYGARVCAHKSGPPEVWRSQIGRSRRAVRRRAPPGPWRRVAAEGTFMFGLQDAAGLRGPMAGLKEEPLAPLRAAGWMQPTMLDQTR